MYTIVDLRKILNDIAAQDAEVIEQIRIPRKQIDDLHKIRDALVDQHGEIVAEIKKLEGKI